MNTINSGPHNWLGIRKHECLSFITISSMTLFLSFLTSFYERKIKTLNGLKDSIQVQTATMNWGFSIYNFFLTCNLNPFKVLVCSDQKSRLLCASFPNTVKGEAKLLNSVTTSSISPPALHSPSPSSGNSQVT